MDTDWGFEIIGPYASGFEGTGGFAGNVISVKFQDILSQERSICEKSHMEGAWAEGLELLALVAKF